MGEGKEKTNANFFFIKECNMCIIHNICNRCIICYVGIYKNIKIVECKIR